MTASESASGIPGEARQRLAFALDYPTLDDAHRAATQVAAQVGVLKVGLELFVREGPRAVQIGAPLGCGVFLDLKLHDIPATVSGAVASACALGARYLTLHAGGGPRMIEAARQRVEKENTGLELLAVTVLTSLDDEQLAAVGVGDGAAEQVARLAKLAVTAGAHGLVCSVREAAALRAALGSTVKLVTPGIRPALATSDDQKRVGTPSEAIGAGSDLLVVGRPIRHAEDPRAAAIAIVNEIQTALSSS